MISSTTRAVLLYGGAAIAVTGIALMVLRRRARTLPEARTVSAPMWRRALARWTPAALTVLGIGGAYWAYRHSIDVVLVTGDGAPHVERKLASSIDTPIAPGARDELSNTIGDSVWVVNESSTTVRVETIQYGGASDVPLDEPPVVFPPDTAGIFYHVDHIGPDHPPPRTVIGSRMFAAFRTWLTWGAPAARDD